MGKNRTRRKQLFRAALAVKGQTQESWATAHDLTPQHLSLVLNGKRESGALTTRIDEYIAETFGKRTAALAS